MKKLLKICLILAALAALVAVGGFFTLKAIFTPEKIKQKVQTYVAQNFHRQVTFDEVKFNFIGLTLTNFALSEESTFEQGTFVRADQLVAKVAVGPLLKKEVRIDTLELDGLNVQIIARKDGTFNFSSLIPAEQTDATTTPQEQPAQSSDTPFVLVARQMAAHHCTFSYQDQSTGDTTTLTDLNLTVTDFNLADPFQLTLDVTTKLTQENAPAISIPLKLDATISLANLDLPQADAKLNSLQARYKNATLTLQGKAVNFENPAVSLSGTLSGVNGQTLADFAPDLAAFSMPDLHFEAEVTSQLENSTAQISHAKLSVADSALSASGTLNWQNDIAYNLSGKLSAHLAQLFKMTGQGDAFEPTGVIDGSFTATEENNFTDLSGSFVLKNLGVAFAPYTLTQLNGTVKLNTLNAISVRPLTGLLNGEKFTAAFDYKQTKNVLDLVLNLDLDKLTLASFGTGTQSEKQTATQNTSASSQTSASDNLITNFKAAIHVGEIAVPYFRSNGLDLTADLTGLTDAMTQANGNASFTFKPGAITDLNTLIGQSKWVKILFLPLTVVRKVSDTLNLGLFPSDKDNGSIAFTQAEGSYTFTNGIMNVDKTIFKSTVTTINATGNIHFPKDTMDMRATATLLTQAAPIAIKITGSPSDPKGKLDVVNTIGSVVGGLLTGKSEKGVAGEGEQAVSDTVTDAANTIKQLGNLFKKKK